MAMKGIGLAGMMVLAVACARPVVPAATVEPEPRLDAATRARARLFGPGHPRAPLNARPPLETRLVFAANDAVPWPLRRPPAMRPHLETSGRARAGCKVATESFADGYAAAWCFVRAGDRARGRRARASRGHVERA